MLNMPCPLFCEAHLRGDKITENRATELLPEQYWLRAGSNKKWRKTFEKSEKLKPFLPMIDELEYPEEQLEEYCGKVVGQVEISEVRTPGACNGYKWVCGPKCHVVAQTRRLKAPVAILAPSQNAYFKLKADVDTHEQMRALLQAQVSEGPCTRHDLTTLNPPSTAGAPPPLA